MNKEILMYRQKVKLTKKQIEELKPLLDVLDYLNKNKSLGATFAQIYPYSEKGNPPLIDFVVLPHYKGKQINKILKQKPTGLIKRRQFVKIKIKNGIMDFIK